MRGQEEAPKQQHAAPDASFLDRMMRPTASSSSKTRARDEGSPVAVRTTTPSRRVSGVGGAKPKIIKKPDAMAEPEVENDVEHEVVEDVGASETKPDAEASTAQETVAAGEV